MSPFDPRLPIIAAQARVRTTHVFHCFHAMREMGKAFHVEAFAQFAGLETRHVEAIIAALAEHEATPSKRSAGQRGTRLPTDWTLPDEWRDWAIEQKRWEPSAVADEAAGFADYWQSLSGARAAKLDWRKTWQNWVRNSRRPEGDYRPQEKRRTPEQWVAYCEEQLRRCEDKDYRQGIQEWSERLAQAREKLVGDKVVPINRANRL